MPPPARRPPQEELFLQSEGDAWFRRNVASLTGEGHARSDLLSARAITLVSPSSAVVDVGASNGWRAAALQEATGATVIAVEPSAAAIEDGKGRYPRVRFVQGVAGELPLPTNSADLVLVSFVLHWLDRSRLLAAVAEIDRILRDGGHLLLSDFLPEVPTRVAYHHRPEAGAWTYKQDYAQLFLAGGLYSEVERVVIDHRSGQPAEPGLDPKERGFISLLRKDLQAPYAADG
jgi:ubiquinone/menaquinone biosynthesis C-methylase UbiE